MAEVEKAYLTFENEPKTNSIKCMFNPETIAISASNKWGSKPAPGQPTPSLQFEGQDSGTMSIGLIFDTTDEGDPVTKYTSKILKKMEIDPDLPGSNEEDNNGRPPYVEFHWGSKLKSFKAVITKADITFDYFSSEGVPLRARVTLALTQFQRDDAFLRQNPTSGTPRPQRMHRIQRGETLDRISARYYGDSTRWRALAAANSIEDPLAIRPGSLLTIPQLDT
jgi:hypothetical protein